MPLFDLYRSVSHVQCKVSVKKFRRSLDWQTLNRACRRVVLVALLMNPGTGLGKLCAGDNVWTRLRLEGGFISTLTIDPQNAGNLYAKTALGLFKTTDGGASWNFLNSTLMTKVSPGSLVIDPQNPNTLYAGIGGDLGRPQSGGIFKSNDGGTT